MNGVTQSMFRKPAQPNPAFGSASPHAFGSPAVPLLKQALQHDTVHFEGSNKRKKEDKKSPSVDGSGTTDPNQPTPSDSETEANSSDQEDASKRFHLRKRPNPTRLNGNANPAAASSPQPTAGQPSKPAETELAIEPLTVQEKAQAKKDVMAMLLGDNKQPSILNLLKLQAPNGDTSSSGPSGSDSDYNPTSGEDADCSDTESDASDESAVNVQYTLRPRQPLRALAKEKPNPPNTNDELKELTPQEKEAAMLSMIFAALLGNLGAAQPPSNAKAGSEDEGSSDSENEQNGAGVTVVSHKKKSIGPNGFERIAGMEPLKTELRQLLIDPIQRPEVYKEYGLHNTASGVLLYGPPGCGKTFFAKAVAEEAGANFMELHPSSVASPYIHQTGKLIGKAFDDAAAAAKKTKKPTVILIDEIDAMAPQRSGETTENHNNEEVAEFLNRLNECSNKNVFVVATTNLPHRLDPALVRSGRMNAKIYVGEPDEKNREQVLRQYMAERSPKVVDEKLDIARLAKETKGYSIADLKELVNSAARKAVLTSEKISHAMFKEAFKQVKPSLHDGTAREYKDMIKKFEPLKEEMSMELMQFYGR